MLVAQNLLDGLYIHTVLQHKGGGCMAQLVGGVFCAVQTGIGQVFFTRLWTVARLIRWRLRETNSAS